MKPKVALTIGAVTALFFGLMLIAAPSKMLEVSGLDAHGDGILLSRDVGVLLLGLAVLNWLGRDADGVGLRAILIANIFVQVAELVVNGVEVLRQALPGAAWPGLALHFVLAIIFGLALASTRRDSASRTDSVAD